VEEPFWRRLWTCRQTECYEWTSKLQSVRCLASLSLSQQIISSSKRKWSSMRRNLSACRCDNDYRYATSITSTLAAADFPGVIAIKMQIFHRRGQYSLRVYVYTWNSNVYTAGPYFISSLLVALMSGEFL
jgi:hypothetical protein